VEEAIKLSGVENIQTIVFNREHDYGNNNEIDLIDLMNNSKAVEAIPVPSNHPAYILYTSGTTGSPKGYTFTYDYI
jgi:propionyl-CoA synthetase